MQYKQISAKLDARGNSVVPNCKFYNKLCMSIYVLSLIIIVYQKTFRGGFNPEALRSPKISGCNRVKQLQS